MQTKWGDPVSSEGFYSRGGCVGSRGPPEVGWVQNALYLWVPIYSGTRLDFSPQTWPDLGRQGLIHKVYCPSESPL